jgi:hypothetical protein
MSPLTISVRCSSVNPFLRRPVMLLCAVHGGLTRGRCAAVWHVGGQCGSGTVCGHFDKCHLNFNYYKTKTSWLNWPCFYSALVPVTWLFDLRADNKREYEQPTELGCRRTALKMCICRWYQHLAGIKTHFSYTMKMEAKCWRELLRHIYRFLYHMKPQYESHEPYGSEIWLALQNVTFEVGLVYECSLKGTWLVPSGGLLAYS